jgi:predicted ATP-grasp superfamily ATP-dependent carboligase
MKILFVDSLSNQVTEAARGIYKSQKCTIDIAIPSGVLNITRREKFKTRYIDRVYKIASPVSNFDTFRTDLLSILNAGEYDAVLPFGYKTTVALSLMKSDINEISSIFIADKDVVMNVHDKNMLAATLLNAGFDVPKIYGKSDIFGEDDCIDYPVVVKARKASGVENSVRYANNSKELNSSFKEISSQPSANQDIDDFSDPLVQEYIQGDVYDGLFLCDNGSVLASMASKRDVVYPASGGVGVEVSSISDPVFMKYCSDILSFINWTGPCQVEAVKDIKTGKYKLIEINPKLWGTLGCSIHAGINFALLSVLKAQNIDININEDLKEYKATRYAIIFPMFVNSLVNIKERRLRRVIVMIFNILTGKVRTEVSILDPAPNIIRIADSIYEVVFKRSSRIIKSDFNNNLKGR